MIVTKVWECEGYGSFSLLTQRAYQLTSPTTTEIQPSLQRPKAEAVVFAENNYSMADLINSNSVYQIPINLLIYPWHHLQDILDFRDCSGNKIRVDTD